MRAGGGNYDAVMISSRSLQIVYPQQLANDDLQYFMAFDKFIKLTSLR